MTGPGLPAELVAFLDQNVQSVRQLEILLYMHAHRTEEFAADAVAHALAAHEAAASRWLQAFVGIGLLDSNLSQAKQNFSYKPKDEKLDALVTLLAKEYKVRPLKVIDVIASRPTTQMMSFMHAFKIGKEEPSDDS